MAPRNYFLQPLPAPLTNECNATDIHARLVPIHLRGLELQKSRPYWLTRDDWIAGVKLLSIEQERLLMPCSEDIIESNNRIYRLLDTTLNGTAYTTTPNPQDPTSPIVSPAIPPAPPDPSPANLPAFALRSRLERLINLIDNLSTGQQFPLDPAFLSDSALQNNVGIRETLTAMQGIINAGWFGIGGQRATLADIVTALRIGTPEAAAQIDTVLETLSAGSSSAVIFDAVRDLFTDSVNTGLEGANLGVLIASTLASVATNTLLTQKLDRIIGSLDGGDFFAPGDNVLTALRGTSPASSSRNVIDAQGGNLGELLDQVESLLGEIRDYVR